jgi:DNA-binding response OmpR family regulator
MPRTIDALPRATVRRPVRVVASSGPDAVLLDVGLPDLDGLEVSRRLRRAGNRVPILC